MSFKYYVLKIIEEDKDLVENFLDTNKTEFADFFEIQKEKYNKIKE
jgi:hypothetical protein